MTQDWITLDTASLDFTDATTYQKNARVTVRIAQPGEHLTTTLADGTVETSRVLEGGEVIIRNPGQEEYAIRAEQFADLYEHVEGDIYQAKGRIKAMLNPTGRPIRIMAPWGEWQYGDENCWLAQGIDPVDLYIVGGAEFADTYDVAKD